MIDIQLLKYDLESCDFLTLEEDEDNFISYKLKDANCNINIGGHEAGVGIQFSIYGYTKFLKRFKLKPLFNEWLKSILNDVEYYLKNINVGTAHLFDVVIASDEVSLMTTLIQSFHSNLLDSLSDLFKKPLKNEIFNAYSEEIEEVTLKNKELRYIKEGLEGFEGISNIKCGAESKSFNQEFLDIILEDKRIKISFDLDKDTIYNYCFIEMKSKEYLKTKAKAYINAFAKKYGDKFKDNLVIEFSNDDLYFFFFYDLKEIDESVISLNKGIIKDFMSGLANCKKQDKKNDTYEC